MASKILLISDLHLEDSRPEITASLLYFLQSNEGACDALYILGDLFDVWIGDDDVSELAISVAAALKAFNDAGASIYIMHGNRDFLIGADFAQRCGAALLADPYVLQSAAGPILLLHGDQLCTDDTDYMQFRDMVRQESWQQEFLRKSLKDRSAFAQQAREQSRLATASKPVSIMDVNQAEVQRLLADTGQLTMIHGHTHRPAIHDVALTGPINGQTMAKRIVLGDWHQMVWFGEISSDGVKLQHLPLQT